MVWSAAIKSFGGLSLTPLQSSYSTNFFTVLTGIKSFRCRKPSSCAAMDIRNWHKLRSKSIRLGQKCIQPEYDSHSRWLVFWRKIKRVKMKNSSSSVSMQTSYDPDTYLKNFDEGLGQAEPDCLHRSFSARFADPSRRFYKNELWIDVEK
ncbi:unnamed protein product [Ilex paraguariensis]|uniref:Uncharacterized protein n=1 Tax=Ilex paraguariensis TaxID=185542 RepID=A0ABC8UPJ8_9AQUA